MPLTGNVSVVLGKDFASTLGRKGTASDVTLYNNKTGDCVLSFVEPSAYPEKIQSLISALYMADQALFKVAAVDAFFAESVIALDAAGVSSGFLVLGDGVSPDAVKKFVAGTVVSSYPVVEEQVVKIRESLAGINPQRDGEPMVQIDHSFDVRGVGTVALGVVKQGVLKKHMDLFCYPGKKRTNVKSIQVHDVDVEDASCGVRVGLSLKNLEPEEVPRGSILSSSESVKVDKSVQAEAAVSKYSPTGLSDGGKLMVSSAMNYSPARVVSGSVSPGEFGRVWLEFEKELPLLPGRMLFFEPNRKPPRVFGYARL